MDPIYETNYMGSKVLVFNDKLVWRFMLKEQTIPISQIASVNLELPMYAGVTVETTGGKKYKIPVNAFGGKKKELQEAIYKAQSLINKAGGSSSADELEKLASLKDRGIITSEEFDLKKKKLLDL